jgi:voltage-gated potassium channel
MSTIKHFDHQKRTFKADRPSRTSSHSANERSLNADSLAQPSADVFDAVWAADRIAKPMFCLSLVFLALVAGLVVAWVDVLPDVPAESLASATTSLNASAPTTSWQQPALQAGYLLLWTLLAIWPLFLVEPIYYRWLTGRQSSGEKERRGSEWWSVVCPPLRLGKSIGVKSGKIWLPGMGWRHPGKTLHKELERFFSKPMLIIALMILPVLLIEFRFQNLLQSTPWLKLVLSITMGLIWCAFTCEFILMVSATKKKLAYIKKNWIDLAIILLPLVSFLRSLRIVRAAKVARFAKLQQLTKMGRVYRMRGLIAKTIRAFLVLELVHRILKTSPEKRLKKLLAQVDDKQDELFELQQQIATIREELASQPRTEAPSTEIGPVRTELPTAGGVSCSPSKAA